MSLDEHEEDVRKLLNKGRHPNERCEIVGKYKDLDGNHVVEVKIV